jgi:hypothetical protein
MASALSHPDTVVLFFTADPEIAEIGQGTYIGEPDIFITLLSQAPSEEKPHGFQR